MRNPDHQQLADDTANAVRSLPNRIRKVKRLAGDVAANVTVEIYYFRHEPTFRAAMIGDAVLGVQMYQQMKADEGKLELGPGPLRIITTSYSAQFDGLRKMVVDFLSLPTVDKFPNETIA